MIAHRSGLSVIAPVVGLIERPVGKPIAENPVGLFSACAMVVYAGSSLAIKSSDL